MHPKKKMMVYTKVQKYNSNIMNDSFILFYFTVDLRFAEKYNDQI